MNTLTGASFALHYRPPEALSNQLHADQCMLSWCQVFQSHKESLTAFFNEHKPDNVDKVDKLLQGYAGREDVLYQKLGEKYGSSPTWPQGVPMVKRPPKAAKKK